MQVVTHYCGVAGRVAGGGAA